MDCLPGADPAIHEHLACDAALEPTGAVVEGASLPPDAESWRGEVAVRLERYRARRAPRAPRYPSLLLPFDSAASWSRSSSETDSAGAAGPTSARQSIALRIEEQPAAVEVPSSADAHPAMAAELEPSARVIEFPRSAAIPISWLPELAEAVIDHPRIVEAPEVLPPPPALGGILMEPATAKEENRTGADIPQFSASIPQRLLAGLVDRLILGSALAAFAAIFLRLNPARAPLPVLIAGFLIVTVLLWAAYEFLFVVYTGSTPGLRALRLRLVRFDGSPVGRRVRRWRVLASFLSACSLGLGYLWSVLDEDGLCWHDRITHTHIQSGKQAE
ncbi:MAG TPA: RDD family protein [Terriglobales bacterium]